MPNPNNNISLRGEVYGSPRILSRDSENGPEEFAARFELLVKRNYRGLDGVYRNDIIPIRYVFGENRKEFMYSITSGDKLSLCGSFCREKYDGAWHCFVNAESISMEEKAPISEEIVTADFDVNLSLPY